MTIDPDLALRFERGETAREETLTMLRAVLVEEPPDDAAPEPPPAGAYDEALERAIAAAPALERRDRDERRGASEMLEVLLALPEGERESAVESGPEYHSWALADLLRQRSFAAGTEDAARSRHLARLAVAVAERAPEVGGERLRADLMAAAWAQLGNAERVATDLPAADAALATALDHLGRGTGDPLPRARALSFLASLRSDQSRFDEAVELARRAASLYGRAGDDHGYGRTLLKLATFHAYRHELDLACGRLDEALVHLDAAAEPRLVLLARHNRASYLERAGRLEEAAAELAAARPLAEAALDRLRLRWLEGRLELARSSAAAGEEVLAEVRAGFLEAGLGYEAAQVSLELAVLYAEQGRTADQRRLAEEMVPLFAARGVHPEARAALALYCDAALAEAVSARLAREVGDYLDRAQGRPRVAFRRSG